MALVSGYREAPELTGEELVKATNVGSFLMYGVLGGAYGRLTLGLPDIAISRAGKALANRKLRKGIEARGLTVTDVSTEEESLWRMTDKKDNVKFINPDNITEGTYSRDLGEVAARLSGLGIRPADAVAYDIGKFIGSIKPVGKAVRFSTQNIAARPWLLKTMQTGLTGYSTDMLLQVEDLVAEKRDYVDFNKAWQTGGWFTLFGGVIEGARAARTAAADAHIIRQFFRSPVGKHALRQNLTHEDLKHFAAAGRAARDGSMSNKAWLSRYAKNRRLTLIVDKLQKSVDASKWKPPELKLLPEKAGVSTGRAANEFRAAYYQDKVDVLKSAIKKHPGVEDYKNALAHAQRQMALSQEVAGVAKGVETVGVPLDAAPVSPAMKSAAERNPYLTMSIERIQEDAQHGVELAKEAIARLDPTAELGKSVITPATPKQLEKIDELRVNHELTDDAFTRLAEYATGESYPSTMNIEQAKEFVHHLKDFNVLAKDTEVAAEKRAVAVDINLPKGANARIRKVAGSDEVLNKTMLYSHRLGGAPSNISVPDIDNRRGMYASDLEDAARVQRRFRRKVGALEPKGKEVNMVNPWSSARYALAQAEVKSGVPLRRMFSNIVGDAVGMRNTNDAAIEEAIKLAGISRIGAPVTFDEGKQITAWLYEEDPTAKEAIWKGMEPHVQSLTASYQGVLQNRSANLIRWHRWINWDAASRDAVEKMQKIQKQGRKLTKKKLDEIMKPVRKAKPPNAPASALMEGRAAREAGQLMDWMETQTWGTRKFYYMSEQELSDMTNMPSGSIPEEFEQGPTLVGKVPQPVLPETMTREGQGKIAKGGSVTAAILNHMNRVGISAATYENRVKFWDAFAHTNPSTQDIARVRSLMNTVLGFHHAVDPPIRIARGASRWFWRAYFISPKRSLWFSYRNLHQNIAYGLSQASAKEVAKSAVEMSAAPMSGEGLNINPWIKEDYNEFWNARISQRRQLYHQFILQKQGSIVSDFGDKATAIIDIAGSAPIYSDEVNRLMAWPMMHQTAYRNVQQFTKGKIPAKKLWSNLDIDTMHVSQRLELHRLADSENWREFVNNYAEYKTENIHFRYETALRSVAEQTPTGRVALGLATFPRGTFEIMYQNGIKPFVQGFQSGNYQQSYKGLKAMTMAIFGSRAARWLLYGVTGRVAYGIFDTVFRYTPVAPGPAQVQDLFDDVSNAMWQAQENDKPVEAVADSIMAAASNRLELFIPFCDVALDYYETHNDVYGVRLYALLKKKVRAAYFQETGEKFREADRTYHEKIQHMFWSGAEKGEAVGRRKGAWGPEGGKYGPGKSKW